MSTESALGDIYRVLQLIAAELPNPTDIPTMRDQFAMAALPQLLKDNDYDEAAEDAYGFADAMLRQRKV